MKIKKVAVVRNSRKSTEDDNWGNVVSEIELTEDYDSDSLAGLKEFSHVEIVFVFDKVKDSAVVKGKRRPRGNQDWPETGIFAQRGKNRPNRIGVTIAELIDVAGSKLRVSRLDAIDGTPIIDIKPVIREFLPTEIKQVHQPEWATQLMKDYWK